jgi:hypothetical protein
MCLTRAVFDLDRIENFALSIEILEEIMKAASLSFQAAVVMAVLGMVWGLVMAISGNHSTMPAHAHLILLGWVSLFLFGIFYHLHPAIDRRRTALIQVWGWVVGTLIMTFGVALIHSGHDHGQPFAALGSLVVLADMLLFGWLVLQRVDQRTRASSPAIPGE